jgi:hypothetical protein
MAERSVRRRGEAGNSHVPYENAENDWLPVCESSIMARTHRRSTSQAGYTTAAAPLRHYGSAAALDMREESIYGALGLGVALLKPALERMLSFTGGTTEQKSLNAHVLIEVGPVDPFTTADEPPVTTLGRRGM